MPPENEQFECANVYTHSPATNLVLIHSNSKTTGAAINDALKAAAHSNYAANINDPDWDDNQGIVRIGSTNTVDYPLGYYDQTGINYISTNPLFPGRALFARVSLARISKYVKAKGQLYLAIHNNHPLDLGNAHGAPFAVTGATIGAPAATATAKYLVICETDQNYSIVSSYLDLPASPDAASFIPGVCFNKFSWTRFAGAINYKIYRQIGAGNVFLLESDEFTVPNYIDNNPPTRIDTGSTAFPAPANARPAISSFVATSVGDLDELPVMGESAFKVVEALIPFPSTVNLELFSDPVFRIGFTEAAALELTDAQTNGTAIVFSPAGQFTAQMTGKTYHLTDRADSANQKTGALTFIDQTHVSLSSAPDWTSAVNTLEITAAAPRSILLDLAGLSLAEGNWSAHPEDLAGRPQDKSANPNGSGQGSITGGGGGIIGDGGGGKEDGGRIINKFNLEYNNS